MNADADCHCDEGRSSTHGSAWVVRPSPRGVVIAAWGWLIGLGVLGVRGVWLVGSGREPWAGQRMAVAAIVGVLAVLAWRAIVLRCERYELDNKRVRAKGGVFRVLTVDAPLAKVTNVLVRRTMLERVLGVGTVGVFTAADGGEVVWRWIDCPEHAAERVREAVARAGGGERGMPGTQDVRGSVPQASRDPAVVNVPAEPIKEPMPATPPQESRRIPVLGIAGGIGAGKSTVARAFERLGCHVIDSDVRAKAALEQPRVREQLVAWWGEGIVGADGRIDRAKIAQIIFTSPDERSRLEGLIHPIVRQDRARMIQEAVAAGAAGVIVDAPLLYEVGIDKECDAVVFVDAPREERTKRVCATRGWDEAELARREASQMDVEEKRKRSRFVVNNGPESPGKPDVETQARAILDEVVRQRLAG